MKTRTSAGLLLVFILLSTFSAYAQKDVFTGDWKLNREKTNLTDNSLYLAGITIKVKADTLFTTRVYENSNGEQYPFDENITMNGKDCKIYIYDMPRVSKTSGFNSDGAIIVESITTFYNNGSEDNLNAKEIWKVVPDSNLLAIEFTNKMSAGEASGILYFTKIK